MYNRLGCPIQNGTFKTFVRSINEIFLFFFLSENRLFFIVGFLANFQAKKTCNISSTGPTLNQLDQAIQYISSTGPTLNQLEQAVQYISSTGPT